MNCTPINDTVIVESIEGPKTSPIIHLLMDNPRELQYGKVVATGQGLVNGSGVLIPTGVTPGETVLFTPYAERKKEERNGKKYLYIASSAILAIAEEGL